jgi:hypothetical protein
LNDLRLSGDVQLSLDSAVVAYSNSVRSTHAFYEALKLGDFAAAEERRTEALAHCENFFDHHMAAWRRIHGG